MNKKSDEETALLPPPAGENVEEKMKWSLWCTMVSVRQMCIITAFLHLGLAVLYSCLIATNYEVSNQSRHLKLPVTKSFGAWMNRTAYLESQSVPSANFTPYDIAKVLKDDDSCRPVTPRDSRSNDWYIEPVTLSVTQYDSRIAIVVFHFLSFLFESVSAYDKEAYYSTLKKGQTNLNHFLEYSLSAALMIVTMSVQLEVTDLYTLLGVFCNAWACMIFGFFAEVMFQNNVEPVYVNGKTPIPMHWAAHFAGWVTLAFALVSVVSNMDTFRTCLQVKEIPWFVWGIVCGETVLFGCFGFVQMLTFWKKPRFVHDHLDNDADRAKRVLWAWRVEWGYVILSLIAKTVLGMLIFFGS